MHETLSILSFLQKEMEFQTTKAEFNFRQANDNYDCTLFTTNSAEDPLQTVPDIECLEFTSSNNSIYSEQAVPDSCLYGSLPLSQSCETTPVRMGGAVFTQKRKITPLALSFEDESSDSSTNPDAASSCQPVKKRKKNRRSYLSSDLPVEIRNQRRTVANARERARVGRMANGYDALQKALPKYLTSSKMRKVDILNSAVYHIQNLMGILANSKHINANNNNNTDTTNLQTYWDMAYQETEGELLNFYASLPNVTVNTCSFSDQ